MYTFFLPTCWGKPGPFANNQSAPQNLLRACSAKGKRPSNFSELASRFWIGGLGADLLAVSGGAPPREKYSFNI